MTREEAIKEWIIPALKNTWNEKKNAEILKALEQEPCEDEELDFVQPHKKIEVNLVPCEDAISKKGTLKAMIEQLGIKNEDYLLPAEATLYKVVKSMPPVTPQPKNIHIANIHFDEEKFKEKFKEICKNAPLTILDDSNTPTIQPKTGRWEWVQYDTNPNIGNWHCSECGSIAIECISKKDPSGVPLYKYCPNCGCRMIELQ